MFFLVNCLYLQKWYDKSDCIAWFKYEQSFYSNCTVQPINNDYPNKCHRHPCPPISVTGIRMIYVLNIKHNILKCQVIWVMYHKLIRADIICQHELSWQFIFDAITLLCYYYHWLLWYDKTWHNIISDVIHLIWSYLRCRFGSRRFLTTVIHNAVTCTPSICGIFSK